MTVSVCTDDGIARVEINNPPVNATSQAVRQGLSDTIDEIAQNPKVRAVVLYCAGRTFVAGGDVNEFDQPPMEPHLPDICMRIEKSGIPWVAAIHGTALGGGLELAMACHGRMAAGDAKLGLPEVLLGLIPGAGGTVRLPRLVSAELALEMVAVGKPIAASAALDAGLVDRITDGDLIEAAVEYAHQMISNGDPCPTLSRPVKAPYDQAGFDAKADAILKKSRGQNSLLAAIMAIRNALGLDPKPALTTERATFFTLRADPQSKSLRHIFFAERATGRIERIKDVPARVLAQIGVIGGGTMGAGIAAACLLAGFNVIMIERDKGAAELGQKRVFDILAGSLRRGLLTQEKHSALCAAFLASTGYDDLAAADMVIEAVFEDMAVKKEVFQALQAATRPDAILATNTSYLDVNQIAATLDDPSRVIGLHFFSPAHIMKLLEIIAPEKVANDVLATGLALAKRLKKIAVVAGVCDGFIANRIMSAYRRECEYMLEDGALPWEIDRAMLDFGLPMGIFQMQDLAGLDISWAMRKRQAATRDPSQRYVDIADKLCEMGRLGRKTGKGWYDYTLSIGKVDPEVEELILSESSRKGIIRKNIAHAEIITRILGVMQAEGGQILAEGIARNADDIDVVMVNAYGFPRWRGGPMYQQQLEAKAKGFET
ncbi:MAG: 3-hydroxyacyl-CoA dehydrogenase NAD-binding domain-containing protein [Paracoccaceae bacterium]